MRIALFALLGLLVWGGPAPARAEEPTPAVKPAPRGEQPAERSLERVDRQTIQASIDKGVAWLLANQHKDGAWGTPASNLHDIFAPVPGSQRAFRVASSALALSALLDLGSERKEVLASIARAKAWLIEHHDVRRIRPNTLYNTWAHAYALEAFARLLAVEKDAATKKALRAAAQRAVERLVKWEAVEGGWGYYDFQVGAARPGPGSTSFTTATGLVALKMAADQGVRVPRRLVTKALAVLRMTRRPDGAYAYSVPHRFYPQGGVNKIKGSLARTPPCLEAWIDWGPEAEVTRAKGGVKAAFDNLEKYGHFLRIARKYPIPHETWYQNSGYFCFYGYYYAARLLQYADPEVRRTHAHHIARHLVGMQEKDGSWWDYQLFNFHKPYGTGYVVMALLMARDLVPAAE